MNLNEQIKTHNNTNDHKELRSTKKRQNVWG